MRQLHVDLEELASAFDNSSDELNFYLDLETGKVELVTEETRREMEAFDEIEEDAAATNGEHTARQFDLNGGNRRQRAWPMTGHREVRPAALGRQGVSVRTTR